ncbi:metallophosphoesterase [bacterium]|nr:metallophosphoesterase [bacterium]
MRRVVLSLSVALVAAALLAAARLESQDSAPEQQQATGIVFHDANGNGKFDAGEKPLPGVRVSNGVEITKTDNSGRYQIGVTDDTIVFVVKPSGWRTPLDENNLPIFYYNHKPHGSPPLKFKGVAPSGDLPKSIDFPLTPQDEPEKFKAVLFGDPQPRDQMEVDYIAHDVIEELVGTDASFGVTLGDIVFDDLNMFGPQARSIALLGIPWYNVIGNHDINYDAANDRMSDETFERHFGPAYYSFDHGQVHFVVLDDIEWYIPDGAGKGRYRGGLGEDQIEFVKNDLALVPDEQLVVLMMHIPIVDVEDRQELYRIIEKRPLCISISGHTHHHEHRFVTREDGWMGAEPHHHIINVTVSGSWWSGVADDRSIPHTMCADGTPNGYSIISFDGADYSLELKAAGRAVDYQMNIHTPEVVTTTVAPDTDVFVNVFNGSERSTVEMRVDSGEWKAMQRSIEIDPAFARIVEAEKLLTNKPWRDLPKPKNSTHLWKAKLPGSLKAGSHLIDIRSTDMFGQKSSGRRIIRVVDEAQTTRRERPMSTSRQVAAGTSR